MASSCAAQPAPEPTMRVLIDKSLDQRLVEILGIDTDAVTIRSSEGQELEIQSSALAAMVPATQWHSTTDDPTKQTRGAITMRRGSLVLTDGQRLTGAPSVIGVNDELVAWSHPRLGIVSVPIELTQSITMPRSVPSGKLPASLKPGFDDAVLLINGDTLRGFVETIGIETAIELRSSSVIHADTGHIDQISLANEPARAMGTHIWLADGSVLAVAGLETEYAQGTPLVMGILQGKPIAPALGSQDPSEADGQPFGLAFRFAPTDLHAINFDSQLLVPLSSLDAKTVHRELAIEADGFAALGCTNIRMPGPMRATWQLPRGATHLSLTATLPLEAQSWGNLVLIVRTDDTEAARHTVNADAPTVRINLDIAGDRTFSLEIDQGEFGPVQDQLVLSQGLVFIGN